MKNLALIFAVLFAFTAFAQDKGDYSFEIEKSAEEWKTEMTKEQFSVMCGGGTEAPFTGALLNNKEAGTYTCAACNNPLFSSTTKFDSGSGWPSFFNQIDDDAIVEKIDKSHGMVRKEIVCAKCGGHLGHVFDDGPAPTGLRYCVNSVSMAFIPANKGSRMSVEPTKNK